MNAFSLVIALSVSLGLGWTAVRTPAKIAVETVDQGLATLTGALMIGRVGFVAAQWGYFQAHPLEILQLWSGGLSASGALLGAVLALLLVGWWAHRNPGALADRLLPLGAALVAGAWLACWISGAAYGAETSAWWGLPALDEQGMYLRRVPVQLFGAVAALAWYALLEAGQTRFSRLPAGVHTSTWLLGTALSLFGLSFLRQDTTQVLAGLRLDAWGALLVAVVSIVLAIFMIFKKVVGNE